MCLHPVTAIIALGWLTRRMAAIMGAGAAPGWILGPQDAGRITRTLGGLAANIRDGRVSLVGIGRNALSHPDFGGYVMQGKPLDPKRLCRTFSECTALMRAKHNALGQFATGCPPFDKAVYGPIFDESEATKPR